MKDFWGIAPALKSSVDLYFSVARQTGRTTRLVESLKTGDRVIVMKIDHGRHIQRLCKERDVDITFSVIDVNDYSKLYSLGTSEGSTIFDHVWLEFFYKNELERLGKFIEESESRLSGYDWRHRETARRFAEEAEIRAQYFGR